MAIDVARPTGRVAVARRLMVVESLEAFLENLAAVEELGYDYRSENRLVGNDTHLFLRKVAGGNRTHHLHVVRVNTPEIDDYRLFRDALRADPALARRYEQVKVSLAKEHADDRTRYVTEKAKWVNRLIETLRTTGST